MAIECRLTTFDNPFDPFEQFASWFLFDVEKGYNTCSHLARIANVTDEMTQKEQLMKYFTTISLIFIRKCHANSQQPTIWRPNKTVK